MKPLSDLPMKPHTYIGDDDKVHYHEGYRFELCTKCDEGFVVAKNDTTHKTCGNPKSKAGGCP